MNYVRTAILLAGLTALFMAIGYLLGGPGGAFGDDVGHLFQTAAVDGQEAETRSQPTLLDHSGFTQ